MSSQLLHYNRYATELSKLDKWNYTTVVRAHYPFKPHIADEKVYDLVRDGVVKSVWYCIEPDRDDTDRYTSTRSINHLHLLMDIPYKFCSYFDMRKEIAYSMGVNKKAVHNIEEIKNVKQISSYVLKHITASAGHHNYFTNNTFD